jgi:hypothetical protein
VDRELRLCRLPELQGTDGDRYRAAAACPMAP